MTAITAASKKAMEAAARLTQTGNYTRKRITAFSSLRSRRYTRRGITAFQVCAMGNATGRRMGTQLAADGRKRRPQHQGAGAALESIRKGIANLLSDDTREALQTWAILAPYIEAEADENPGIVRQP